MRSSLLCVLLLVLSIPISLIAQIPSIAAVVNAGDYTAAAAPGAIVSVFGQNLASATASAIKLPLPTTLGSTLVQLTAGGQTSSLPLFYVSAGQINAQLSYGISGTAQLQVKTAAGASNSLSITITPAAPRLFTWTSDGKGDAVMLHANYTAVNAGSPATPGEVVILYLTGLGEVWPAGTAGTGGGDGSAASPLNLTQQDVAIQIGGQPADVLYSGLAPYFAGLYQINFRMPLTLLNGGSAITISAAGSVSQAAASVPIASNWKADNSATIGPSGGTVSGSTASITVGSGAMPAAGAVGIFRNASPAPGPGDKYRASDIVSVSGLPASPGGSITITLNLTQSPQPSGVLIAVLPHNGDGTFYLNATVNGSQATATIPAVSASAQAYLPESIKPADAAPSGQITSSFSIWAVTGYYAITSAGGHFKITYPAADLVEGGADVVAAALETAYTKLANLGFDWGRRNGISSWPIAVSIEYFDGDRSERWGEEGSAKWVGVQRQGINLNAYKLLDRANFETMRITAGHELFHLMQNLYDLETAPSTWLWMEEALSTWFERRMATDPNYIPATVAALSGLSSTNYLFLEDHGLEYPPGDPKNVQNHGYGASMFLESLTRRKGDPIVATIAKLMATRAPGLTAHPLYSPVAAINSATSDVGSEWELFCEAFMAGQAYGGSPVFPRPDVEIPAAASQVYNWPNATDPGPLWTYSYPDLSARIYLLNLRNAQWPAGTNLTISLDGGGTQAAAIVYRYSKSGTSVDWTKLAVVRDTPFVISNAQTLIANNQNLVIMVANSRASAPYNNRTPMTLRFSATGFPAYRRIGLSPFYPISVPLNLTRNQDSPPSTSSSYNEMVGFNSVNYANVQGTVPLAWSGSSFSAQGRLPGSGVDYYDISVSGQLNAAGTALQTVHFKTVWHLASSYGAGYLGITDGQCEVVITGLQLAGDNYDAYDRAFTYTGADAATKISSVKYSNIQYDNKGAPYMTWTYEPSKPILLRNNEVELGFWK